MWSDMCEICVVQEVKWKTLSKLENMDTTFQLNILTVLLQMLAAKRERSL